MDTVLINSSPGVYEEDTTGRAKKGKGVFRTLGAYKISRSIRNLGFSSQVIDFASHMSYEQLIAALRKFVSKDTAVIGISTTFMTTASLKLPEHIVDAINDIKDEFPNVRLVFGGWSAKAIYYDKRLRHEFYGVGEYGEDIFTEIFLYEKKINNFLPIVSDKIKNFFTSARYPKFDIQTDSHLFTKNDYILPNEVVPIEISRGCIFKCTFCNHLLLGRGKLDYLRDFELVKNEMINNFNLFGTTNYYVICDTFNDTEYKMQAWHKMISSLPFKISYTAYLRADLLDRYRDVPVMLKETGLFSAYHGIETFGPRASQVIGKGWSGKGAKTFIPELYHNIWGGEVKQTLSFIAGLPGDTRESLRDTVQWFEDNALWQMVMQPLSVGHKSLIRNSSEFEMNAGKYGYKLSEKNEGYWENEYWNYKSVVEFVVNEIRPRLLKKCHPLMNSWHSMMLKQYGFEKNDYEKSSLFSKIKDIESMDTMHVNKYFSLLMSDVGH